MCGAIKPMKLMLPAIETLTAAKQTAHTKKNTCVRFNFTPNPTAISSPSSNTSKERPRNRIKGNNIMIHGINNNTCCQVVPQIVPASQAVTN